MSNVAKVAGAAANTLTTPPNVEEVFSTYLYQGTSANQSITNGIDLDGEGGLVWAKARSAAGYSHGLYDTERGVTKRLATSESTGESTYANSVTAFNNNGFSLGSNANNDVNYSGSTYVSWTFRKAPKFFDVVTWTGTGTAGLTVSHNLGSAPGCIIAKRTDASGDNWAVYHRHFGGTHYSGLDSSSSFADNPNRWNDVDATATEFTVGSSSAVNASGGTYVAYLFAHNDSDGGFGSTGDQDIIKCGSYTGNGSSTGPTVDLGFEPQWILLANSSSGTSRWEMYDNMRGLAHEGHDAKLVASLTSAEDITADMIDLLPNGFTPTATASNQTNVNGGVYVYVAIRRGPMAVPESATNVFDIDTRGGTSPTPPGYNAAFPVDMAFQRYNTTTTGDIQISSRLTQGKYLETNTTDAEATNSFYAFDYQDGFTTASTAQSDSYGWMWRRAPKFFDAVGYLGDGVAGRTVSHNLGVVPEMIWIKSRQGSSYNWICYLSALGTTHYAILNETYINPDTGNVHFNSTAPTSTEFTLGSENAVNRSAYRFIAYLFATLAGISKVGSYTGNGTNQTIDCGFSAGARFVLIKGISTEETDWYIWDTDRGIVAANDPHLSLNTTAAQVTTDDSIDPDNSGFIVNQVAATDINVSGATYFFYAIA